MLILCVLLSHQIVGKVCICYLSLCSIFLLRNILFVMLGLVLPLFIIIIIIFIFVIIIIKKERAVLIAAVRKRRDIQFANCRNRGTDIQN
jgi:uncharacterized membrane protein